MIKQMTLEEYLRNLPPGQLAQYKRIKKLVKALVPETEETLSYGIPTFKYKGKYLIYFAGAKNHMSVYPTVGKVKPTPGTKGTFQFTEEQPVPESVISEIVLTRLAKINSG